MAISWFTLISPVKGSKGLWNTWCKYSSYSMIQVCRHDTWKCKRRNPKIRRERFVILKTMQLCKPQFYIQLLYMLHFGICFLPFGLLGSKKKISEKTKFLLKFATIVYIVSLNFSVDFYFFCKLHSGTGYFSLSENPYQSLVISWLTEM